MKKKALLAVVFGSLVLAISCGRKEPPVVVEQTPPAPASQPAEPAAPLTAAQTPAEPTRELPAQRPVAQRPRKTSPAPVAEQQPAPQPNAQPAPQPVASNPAPAPEARPTPAPAPPPEPVRKTVTLAAGTILPIRMGDSLSSEKNEVGDTWTGTLAEPLVIDGMVVAERGARVDGRVTDVKRAGKVKGSAELEVAMTRFTTADGQRVAVQTGSFQSIGKDETKKDAAKVAIASGIGAAIGAIAGRGKGAAIGAGAGAAAGTGAVLMSRGKAAEIDTETLVRFRLTSPVTITERR